MRGIGFFVAVIVVSAVANAVAGDGPASQPAMSEPRSAPSPGGRFQFGAAKKLIEQVQELVGRPVGRLSEVSEFMTDASAGLAQGVTGETVQNPQQRAVDLLDQLIEDAQNQEQQQCRGGGASAKGGARPAGASRSPALQSVLPGGHGTKGELNRSAVARPGEQWGLMRPEERERVLQSLRDRFPSRYRQLVEQYYRQLAKEP